MRLFPLYLVAELAVVVALASTIGLGWTLLLVVAVFVLGVTLAGSQLRAHLRRLRSGADRSTLGTDSVAVALGAVLVVIPGLVSTAAGLLLLMPGSRRIARPLVSAWAVRGLGRRVPLITVVGGARSRRNPRPDYIDGEVIDVTEVDPPALRSG